MLLAAIVVALQTSSTYTTWGAPAGREYATVRPGGTTVMPNGRLLTPMGRRFYTGDDLWHVSVSPDGKTVIGISENRLNIFTNLEKDKPDVKVIQVPEVAPAGTFTKDGLRFLYSTGEKGGIAVLDTYDWSIIKTLNGNVFGKKYTYFNDLAITNDGKVLYAVDIAHQRVVTFDAENGDLISSQPAGREPYACILGLREKRLHVANIGIFDYSVVPKTTDSQFSNRGLSVPPFGYPSKEATEGVRMEGRQVPGLGSAFVPDAQSVWTYDVTAPNKVKVSRKAKSGLLIHSPADGGKSVGGSAPNALLVHNGLLYVSNANNDTISVFDEISLKLVKTFKLSPTKELSKFRGVIPSGMAMNKAGTRLYVCESGLNAVAVLSPKTGETLGHIPTGWFPMKVVLSPDEKSLIVATQKGIGRGPLGEFHKRPESDERFGLDPMPGMVNAIPVPSSEVLQEWSAQVLKNNGLVAKQVTRNPVAGSPGKPSEKIKYVVFITKENHTFDGIFGGLKGAKGEPRYAEFGMEGWIEEKGKGERLPIMPNHIRLAEQFAISDNFYMEPVASGDGHRWLVGVYPSLWTTRVFYAGWDMKRTDEARGRLVSFGSNGSQIPEDYLENGSLWEHLARNKVTFRNYGEGYELPDNDEGPMTNRAGGYTQINHPMPKVLYDNTCFKFPAYNNFIPDIARADWFIEDIEENFRKKNKPLPKFMNIAICNDHGAGARPKDGYPYTCSFMADNDLALGKIVEYLSRQPEWKEMAIFVTQDDSGGDSDHVDRHRSFVLGVSPWIKRSYVTNDHTSIMSIIKTIYQIFGIGPNNMFDAVATDLSDMFTDRPNFDPYLHVNTDPRVFKAEDTFDPTDPKFERRRKMMPSVRMDDPKFIESIVKSRGGG